MEGGRSNTRMEKITLCTLSQFWRWIDLAQNYVQGWALILAVLKFPWFALICHLGSTLWEIYASVIG
jgi:hypothetical protein